MGNNNCIIQNNYHKFSNIVIISKLEINKNHKYTKKYILKKNFNLINSKQNFNKMISQKNEKDLV